MWCGDNSLFSCGGCWLSFGPVVIFRGFEKTSSVGWEMFECQPFNTMDAIRDDLERGMNTVNRSVARTHRANTIANFVVRLFFAFNSVFEYFWDEPYVKQPQQLPTAYTNIEDKLLDHERCSCRTGIHTSNERIEGDKQTHVRDILLRAPPLQTCSNIGFFWVSVSSTTNTQSWLDGGIGGS
jgi:hypothetical protein